MIKEKEEIFKKYPKEVKKYIVTYYLKNNFKCLSNIKEDLSCIKTIKRNLTRCNKRTIKSYKILLNNIITIYNIFGLQSATFILSQEVPEKLHPPLKSCLIHLGFISDKSFLFLINKDEYIFNELGKE